jgi:hypothetical protein
MGIKRRYLVSLFMVMLLLISGQAALANLVSNPGFETGDFSFWTQSGNLGNTGVTTSGFDVHSGTYGSRWGPVGSLGYISQDIPTTAGSNYEISLWYHPVGLFTSELFVEWGADVLMDVQNIPGGNWIQYGFTVAGLAGHTTLTIGLRNDPNWDGLDDISVDPVSNVPEPSSLFLLGAGLAVLALCLRKP